MNYFLRFLFLDVLITPPWEGQGGGFFNPHSSPPPLGSPVLCATRVSLPRER